MQKDKFLGQKFKALCFQRLQISLPSILKCCSVAFSNLERSPQGFQENYFFNFHLPTRLT